MVGIDDTMERLLAYHGRRYWLENGWSVEFRIRRVAITEGRPYGVKYSLTLHDVDCKRLLGYDNAHGVPRQVEWDHRHSFRNVGELRPYKFTDADKLLADFFASLQRACESEGIAFDIVHENSILEPELWEE